MNKQFIVLGIYGLAIGLIVGGLFYKSNPKPLYKIGNCYYGDLSIRPKIQGHDITYIKITGIDDGYYGYKYFFKEINKLSDHIEVNDYKYIENTYSQFIDCNILLKSEDK